VFCFDLEQICCLWFGFFFLFPFFEIPILSSSVLAQGHSRNDEPGQGVSGRQKSLLK
jgi:hypothetical protein